MSDRYKISIVDANSLSCEGVKYALDDKSFNITNRWRSVDEAIASASPNCDLKAILISGAKHDILKPPIVAQLHDTFPGTRIILIGETSDPDRIREALRIEVDGFILETIHITAFSKVIELIILGETFFPPLPPDDVVVRPSSPGQTSSGQKSCTASLEGLSASELRVLALLSKAYSNKVIAQNLGISEATVKVHVKAILRKTHSRNRTDAALLVQDIGGDMCFQETFKTAHPSILKNGRLGGTHVEVAN